MGLKNDRITRLELPQGENTGTGLYLLKHKLISLKYENEIVFSSK